MKLMPWRRHERPLHHELDQLFKGFGEPFFSGLHDRLTATVPTRGFPPVNVTESEGHYTVSVELPGMDPKDIQIEVVENQLTVSGERKWEEEQQGTELHRIESQYGSFSRTLILPENLQPDRESIEATFQRGVLEIKLPKVEATPAAKIPIQAR